MKTNPSRFMGQIKTKIVGMQYADGVVQGGEAVFVERDLENSYDENAIRVQNTAFENVGFLPRKVSSWITPLMDQGKIIIKGKIPEEGGNMSTNRHLGCPLCLNIFLEKKGESILQANPCPDSEKAIVHEMVRNVFQNLLDFPDPNLILGMGKRLTKLVERDILPETHLLLSLFPFKAEEVETAYSENMAAQIQDDLQHIDIGYGLHHQNLTIFPLFRQNGHEPEYKLLKMALEEGTAVIEELTEAGAVNTVLLHNKGSLPILIPEGAILTGAKQNRVINITILVAANSSVKVPVCCVEQGRWSYTSRTFQSTHFAHPNLRRKKVHDLCEARVHSGEAESDQGEVWNEVANYMRDMNLHSSTQSLTEGLQQVEGRIAEYQDAFKLPTKTCGVMVFCGEKIMGMDFFDCDFSFQQYWEQMAKAYFSQALQERASQPKTGQSIPREVMNKIREGITLSKKNIGTGHEFIINTEEFVGTGVIHQGKVRHISVFSTKDS